MSLPFENASAKLKTLKQNDINKCFDKINENVGVNRAPVWTRPSGRARDSGRDTFEKENLIKCKIKELNGASPGFRLESSKPGRVRLRSRHRNSHGSASEMYCWTTLQGNSSKNLP